MNCLYNKHIDFCKTLFIFTIKETKESKRHEDIPL
nr:MAG TPA: hypothetical protein [Herelleviridae sp.]